MHEVRDVQLAHGHLAKPHSTTGSMECRVDGADGGRARSSALVEGSKRKARACLPGAAPQGHSRRVLLWNPWGTPVLPYKDGVLLVIKGQRSVPNVLAPYGSRTPRGALFHVNITCSC